MTVDKNAIGSCDVTRIVPGRTFGLLTSLVISLSGCDLALDLVLDESRPDDPFVFIYERAGLVEPGQPNANGLVVAVWQDGRVIRVDTGAEPGTSYVQGQATDEQIASVLQAIDERGITSLGSSGGVFRDARNFSLYLRLRHFGVIERAESDPSIGPPVVAELISILLSLDLDNVQPFEAPWTGGFISDLPASWFE